ncbi:sugar-transfer associated ATP-grasp domain-containing protein [[Collinsella] massiliensis]|uniref:Alpha-L-glutamate ligase-related protein ATP-grasp domain-containing protein n=1 Tax=[Collinsella] massiliensis TaxID=1232426 RepID=A0A1Y3XM22_9ACTN|nr:sugar-transfer associated ATP-grasp domain-containing protein [[Collinsella] massiliensis]OUN86241.1 hypothetical protein B5G02_08685 [[Collinsella] massiliensis]
MYVEELIANGFTRRMAEEWLAQVEKERCDGSFDRDEIEFAHANGFLAESVKVWDVTEENKQLYLSDYEYARLWPLNSWQRIWINDKLTLKLILAEGSFSKAMPDYYFYSQKGALVPLMNCPNVTSLASALESLGEMACKPCNGSLAQGFYKLAHSTDGFTINGRPVDVGDIERFPSAHPNYIFTEFIRPSDQFCRISPLIHTLRVVVCAPIGRDPFIAASYIRFACGSDQAANYAISGGAGEFSGLFADVDVQAGMFGNGKLVSKIETIDVDTHPESGASLTGSIDEWSDVLNLVFSVSERLRPLEWLGFDIGLTSDGPKIMEINSHPGLHYVQVFAPLLADSRVADYFAEKADALLRMDSAQQQSRALVKR